MKNSKNSNLGSSFTGSYRKKSVLQSSLLYALGDKVQEYFCIMVSRNDCKYCNLIELYKTVFQRFQDYFPILHKMCFLYYFRTALKKASIQF